MKRDLLTDFAKFLSFSAFYFKKKILSVFGFFEENKNTLVHLFIAKRGRYARPFLHVATMGVLAIGVISTPFLASTYPVFSSQNSQISVLESQEQSIIVGEDVFKTSVSQKPRDKIIEYTVQKGDTISTIAEKFGVSADTVRWENALTNDNITIGDTLKILPVTGIAHKVERGESVYSIAKKFDTEAQKIADFPFNDFANPEKFTLVDGVILIVPDGVKPSSQPFIRRQLFIAEGPVSVSSAGFTWPLRGVISQFAAWYHMAIDITSPIGSPIVAAHSGRVIAASSGAWNFGYGTNLEIDNGEGVVSNYAHMSGLNVSVGDNVVAGKTLIGWVGVSGRTTGSHLHFEIKRNGVLINPLSYLQ